eukprot:gene25211-10856_t
MPNNISPWKQPSRIIPLEPLYMPKDKHEEKSPSAILSHKARLTVFPPDSPPGAGGGTRDAPSPSSPGSAKLKFEDSQDPLARCPVPIPLKSQSQFEDPMIQWREAKRPESLLDLNGGPSSTSIPSPRASPKASPKASPRGIPIGVGSPGPGPSKKGLLANLFSPSNKKSSIIGGDCGSENAFEADVPGRSHSFSPNMSPRIGRASFGNSAGGAEEAIEVSSRSFSRGSFFRGQSECCENVEGGSNHRLSQVDGTSRLSNNASSAPLSKLGSSIQSEPSESDELVLSRFGCSIHSEPSETEDLVMG